MPRFKHRFGYTLRRTASGARRWLRDASAPAIVPPPPLTRAERLERETLQEQWNRRLEEERDPVTGRDSLGFDEFGVDEAGYQRDGTVAFGHRLKHSFTREVWDERGFDWRGIHKETGQSVNRRGYDARGWGWPEDERRRSGYPVGTRLHGLTGTPWAPPPSSRDSQGRDRLGRDKAGERNAEWPDPYYR